MHRREIIGSSAVLRPGRTRTPRKHKELKRWLSPGGWNHNPQFGLFRGGLCCHSSCLALFGDNFITGFAKTAVCLTFLCHLLLAMETLPTPIPTPAFIANRATLQLCARSTHVDRSVTLGVVGAEVRLHILAVCAAAIITYGLARHGRSRQGSMAVLAEASPRRRVSCRPVLATKARTSPLTPPARGTHRRTMLSHASIACAESDAVSALCMPTLAFADVICKSKAIEAGFRFPASTLQSLSVCAAGKGSHPRLLRLQGMCWFLSRWWGGATGRRSRFEILAR